MIKKLLSVVSLLISVQIFAQSPRTVLIEHFTNTRCSICATRNPAFYSTLSAYPQVLHIAFHPSSPYSQCFFSLQNPAENDARTNYYGAYGSTPKVVLNGKLLPGAVPLINNTTIDTALNQTSPLAISAYEELQGTDSVKVKVIVKTTGVTPLSSVRLFAGVAENPINYNAVNGETIHHDVFRKALTDVTGNLFALPALNDSSAFEFIYTLQNDWNADNLSTIAFIQRNDTKEILNAAKSVRAVANPSAVNKMMADEFSIYPNPVKNELQIRNYKSQPAQLITIFDLAGRKISEQYSGQNRINVSTLTAGVYFLKMNTAVMKFVKE